VDTTGGKTSVYRRWINRHFVAHTKDETAPEAGPLLYEVR